MRSSAAIGIATAPFLVPATVSMHQTSMAITAISAAGAPYARSGYNRNLTFVKVLITPSTVGVRPHGRMRRGLLVPGLVLSSW